MVVTPIKEKRHPSKATDMVKGDGIDGQKNHNQQGRWLQVNLEELVSSEEDQDMYEDVMEGWDEIEGGPESGMTQEKMESLLQSIDNLMGKEINNPEYSLDKERKQIAKEIQELGRQFKAKQQKP